MTTASTSPALVGAEDGSPIVIPAAQTVCLSNLTASRVWEPPDAFAVNGLVIGVRSDSVATRDQVRSVLSAWPRLPDVPVGPNLSVDLDNRKDGSLTRMALVYWEHTVVARRRHAGTALHDLAEIVTDLPCPFTATEPVLTSAVLRLADGTAVLLPANLRSPLLPYQDRLAAAGIELLRRVYYPIDPSGGTLRQTGARRTAEASVQDQLVNRSASVDMKVHAWVHPSDVSSLTEVAPAQTLCRAVGQVGNRAQMEPQLLLNLLADSVRSSLCLEGPSHIGSLVKSILTRFGV